MVSVLTGALVVGCAPAGAKGFDVGLGKYRDGTALARADVTGDPDQAGAATGAATEGDNGAGSVGAEVAADGTTAAPEVEAGTDSAFVGDPEIIDEGQRSRLVQFGQAYLSFDYREDQLTRVERLQGLVSADLLVDLSAPMPPALMEELVADQRVVTAEEVDLAAVGENVFQLSFDLTTTSASDGSAEPERRVLTVVLDPDGLVSDVR